MNDEEYLTDKMTQEFEQTLRTLEPRKLSEQTIEAIEAAAETAPPASKRLIAWWVIGPLAAAACLAAAFLLFWPDRKVIDDSQSPPIALAGWRIEPTGDARFAVLSERSLRLDEGELYIESTRPQNEQSDAHGLTVLTPEGEAHAKGTRFYIGTHTQTSRSTKDHHMKRLTRILILSGMVSLTNSLGTASGQTSDLLTAEAGAQPAVLAVQASSSFAIDFYKHLAKDPSAGNLFFSPYSISTAMTMVQEGARGQTAQEIGNVLGFPKAAQRTGADSQLIPWQTSLIHSGLAEIDSRLVIRVDPQEQARLKKEDEELSKKFQEAWARYRDLDHAGKKVEADKAMKEAYAIDAQIPSIRSQIDRAQLITANALWVEKTYGLSQNFVDTVSKHYKTGGAFGVDFIGTPDAQRQRINEWVSQQTQGLIKDLLPQDSVSDMTRAVLTNTIYFNAAWAEKFRVEETQTADFHLADGKKIKTPMMTQDTADWCRYGAFTAQGEVVPKDQFGNRPPVKDGFLVLEMPYKGGTTSMLLIAPQDPAGLSRIESRLTPQAISQWAGQLEQKSVSIFIPRFKMQTEYQLKDRLSQMGMPLAFNPGKADFTGMRASPGEAPLYIDDVYHKTFLDVNEAGTIAAAATGVAVNAASDVQLEFRADRPFLFMIRDNKSGTILFMGRVMDPSRLQ